jgi:alpha-N-arabinofuranosidase
VHHDATLLPLQTDSPLTYSLGERSLPAVSVTASRDKGGKVHISLVNIHPEEDAEVTLQIRGMDAGSVTGRILTAGELDAHNTFEEPDRVHPDTFNGAKLRKGEVTLTLPARSVVVLEVI